MRAAVLYGKIWLARIKISLSSRVAFLVKTEGSSSTRSISACVETVSTLCTFPGIELGKWTYFDESGVNEYSQHQSSILIYEVGFLKCIVLQRSVRGGTSRIRARQHF